MKTDTEKMENIVKEYSEHIQNDLLGKLTELLCPSCLDNVQVDNVCEVIVDRTKLLIEKLKQCY